VDSLEIKAGDEVKMKPGEGYHIMLMGLKNPLKAGEKFPMTLTFRQAGTVKITVHVSDKAMTGKPGKADDKVDAHEHHNH
jgi:copper(I)-binding protein